ncbi:MAG: prepilin-type N-terminal cleavage/methylation domain-containing protein [Patescibacteria group bacterium]
MSNFKTNTYGFTLIETVVTLAVLLIGILAIVGIFPLALKINKSAEQTTIATNLAQAKIEEMFYLNYENIDLGTIEAKHRLSSDQANPFYYYQRQTVTEYVDGDLEYSVAETGIKKITVTVFWHSPLLSLEKNTSLMLLISKK